MPDVTTSLGRVLPLFKGDYDSSTRYGKLDVVLYSGNSYISKIDSNSGHTPTNEESPYWQLLATKGQQGDQGRTGGFGTPRANAVSIAYDAEPTVAVSATGSDEEKIFNFNFGIPAGRFGFDSVDATAVAGQAGTPPRVSASLDTETDPNDRKLLFAFTIPDADGSGVLKVDNIGPTAGNVELLAVQYREQTLSSEQKTQVLENIGAQPVGSYISRPISPAENNVLKYNGTTWVAGSVNEVPTSGTTDDFLKKTDDGYEWATIREVPSGGNSDFGKYLQYTDNGVVWNYTLPAGGVANAPLVKNSSSDYDVKWGSIITTSEIDDIMGISNS